MALEYTCRQYWGAFGDSSEKLAGDDAQVHFVTVAMN